MPIEAMVDLTGGLAERYELKDPDMHKTLYRWVRKYHSGGGVGATPGVTFQCCQMTFFLFMF